MNLSSGGSRSNLSSEMQEVDAEIQQLDDEVKRLRNRKQVLLEKRAELRKKLDFQLKPTIEQLEDQWDNDAFSWSLNANAVLKEVFNLPSFRPLQRATINAVMSGEDTIVIMSTGGGKSLCYQLPAVLSKGLTLVVCPLVSLVEDQLGQLKKLGIEAATLNANTSKDELKLIENAITNKHSEMRLLYVTPEKLAKSKRVMNKLEKAKEIGFLKLIAIDEVHCCSQWGHDFRQDYQFLNVLKRQFKGVPILGLTATATSKVLKEVQDMLGIPAALVFRAGFNRPNLHYEIREKTSFSDAIADYARLIRTRFNGQSGIVYCLARKDCEEVTKKLKLLGIKAAYYHAYLEAADRTQIHERWLSGVYHVIVATVAFGMGIDKPDVRYVIHHAIPKSVESYYQESGRAGRDGKESHCIMYFNLTDVFKLSTMLQGNGTRKGLDHLYTMVRFATETSVCRRTRLAEHFEEPWEQGWCQAACDVCKRGSGRTVNFDITTYMQQSEKIILEVFNSKKDSGSKKITSNKLSEVILNRSRPKAQKSFVESVIGYLFLEGYLEEDFHFTSFSVISYAQVGSRWQLNRNKSIYMEYQALDGSPVPPVPKSTEMESAVGDQEALPSSGIDTSFDMEFDAPAPIPKAKKEKHPVDIIALSSDSDDDIPVKKQKPKKGRRTSIESQSSGSDIVAPKKKKNRRITIAESSLSDEIFSSD